MLSFKQSWAVIMAHFLSHSNEMNATPLEYGLVGGLSISQALMVSPIATIVRKRIGLRWTLLIGTALLAISLLTSSYATEIWHLFLSQGFCFGWGMGFTYVTASAVVPPWFTTRRSLAIGLTSAGTGIGGLAYSIGTNVIIEKLGVRWAYRILALCSLSANLLASFLLKEWGTRSQTTADELRFNFRDFRRIEVLLITLWGASTELGFIILLYSLPSYAASIGLSSSQGSVANALFSLGMALGRPLVGYCSDSFGRINMAAAMTLLCTIFCFALWIPASSYAPLLIFSILAGATCGTFWATVTPVLAEVVGINKLTSTFGVICMALVVPTTFAEAAALRLVGDDTSQIFVKAQILVGFMFFVGALSVWGLRCWKLVRMELERRENSSSMPLEGRGRSWIGALRVCLLWSYERV